MKNRKKILLLTLAIVVIAFGCFVWHEYQKDLEITESVRKENEEWGHSLKYPWRSRILESPSDLQTCRMLIYSSDLTDEEKAKEDEELEHRYRVQQLQKEYSNLK